MYFLDHLRVMRYSYDGINAMKSNTSENVAEATVGSVVEKEVNIEE